VSKEKDTLSSIYRKEMNPRMVKKPIQIPF